MAVTLNQTKLDRNDPYETKSLILTNKFIHLYLTITITITNIQIQTNSLCKLSHTSLAGNSNYYQSLNAAQRSYASLAVDQQPQINQNLNP
jgi:hypothetical protein